MSSQMKGIQERAGDKGERGATSSDDSHRGGMRQITGQMIEKITGQARQQVMTKLSGQKDMAAERLVNLSDALRKAGESIQGQAPPFAVDYLTRAAGKMKRLSGYLLDSDVERMLGDAEGFVRRNGGLVLGGAIVTGFLLGRFLKSSAPSEIQIGGQR